MIDNYIENTSEGKWITLATPIKKGKKTITQVLLKKPNAGSLRGLSLIKVMEMDFDVAQVLLPRLSELNERDVLNLEPENLPPLMMGITSFFVNVA